MIIYLLYQIKINKQIMKTQSNFADGILNETLIDIHQTQMVESTNEILDKFKLNWRVNKSPLYLADGTETGFFGLVRQDTNHTFSTCKDSYIPFQNDQLAELVYQVSKHSGYEMHAGGSFQQGSKVFIQLNTNEISSIGANKTKVKGFVTALNSHDGSMALKWGSSNITICCQNTFYSASRQLANSIKHTTNINARVMESLRQIENVMEDEKYIFSKYLNWSTVAATKENIAEVIGAITNVDINSNSKEISAIARNKTNILAGDIAHQMAEKGETLWGLFSGVTKYTTHHMTAPTRENGRLEHKMAGGGLSIDNKIFNLMELIAN